MKIRSICEEGVELIKRYESFINHTYVCPAGKLTIGYGHLLSPNEIEEYDGKTISEEEAVDLLSRDLKIARLAVQKYIDVPLSDLQFAALVSFTFNLGAGALQRSTLRSMLNRGEYEDAADQFLRWVYASGRKLKGLIRRRNEERDMFLAGYAGNGNGEDNGAD